MESGRTVEADLVERARRGDAAAFEELVRAHQDVAFRTAWTVSGGADDAEDAAQEAFVKAYRALERFRPGASFRAWLLAIVANEARNRRRAAGRRTSLTLRLPVDPRPDAEVQSPEAAVMAGERRAALLAGLEQLSDIDRQVITLRYLLQLSEAETAAALDVPPGTVKSRLSRGLAHLREELIAMEAPR